MSHDRLDPAALADDLVNRVHALASLDALREAEASLVGRRSPFAELQRTLGALEEEERRS
ncbi:MAG: hypothetical protein ACYCRG_07555, partial [Acidimicrobiales bacterium]